MSTCQETVEPPWDGRQSLRGSLYIVSSTRRRIRTRLFESTPKRCTRAYLTYLTVILGYFALYNRFTCILRGDNPLALSQIRYWRRSHLPGSANCHSHSACCQAKKCSQHMVAAIKSRFWCDHTFIRDYILCLCITNVSPHFRPHRLIGLSSREWGSGSTAMCACNTRSAHPLRTQA